MADTARFQTVPGIGAEADAEAAFEPGPDSEVAGAEVEPEEEPVEAEAQPEAAEAEAEARESSPRP